MINNRKQPLRKCIGCGEMKNKKELLRVIRTPEDEIVLDETGKKNGRGAYVCKSLVCMKKAVTSKGFERSLKVSIPQEVSDRLEKELRDIEEREE